MARTRGNKSAAKVLEVLDMLFCDFANGYTQAEIAAATGLNATAAHRCIQTLLEAGYAEEIRGGKRYRPSHRLAQKTLQVLNSLEVARKLALESDRRMGAA